MFSKLRDMLILAMIVKLLVDPELIVSIGLFLVGLSVVYVAKFTLFTIIYIGNGYFKTIQEKHLKHNSERNTTADYAAAGLWDLRTMVGIDPEYEIKVSDLVATFLKVTAIAVVGCIYIQFAFRYAETGFII